MTRYDIAMMCGYNSVEEYDEAEKINNKILEDLKRRKSYVEKEPVKIQPAKHGRWELTDNPSFRKCSECGAWWSSDITDNCFTNYCPKCGARMDGDING